MDAVWSTHQSVLSLDSRSASAAGPYRRLVRPAMLSALAAAVVLVPAVASRIVGLALESTELGAHSEGVVLGGLVLAGVGLVLLVALASRWLSGDAR